jgi:type VI protein secretion system component VasF
MEAASVPAATIKDKAATRRKKPHKGVKTPWWMWLSVAAIVLFCLFPFYWLINI